MRSLGRGVAEHGLDPDTLRSALWANEPENAGQSSVDTFPNPQDSDPRGVRSPASGCPPVLLKLCTVNCTVRREEHVLHVATCSSRRDSCN